MVSTTQIKIAMKKYISNSTISVSIVLLNGKCNRVSFSPLSDGRSVFYTSDEDIQWGLEHHYKYGKLFRLEKDTADEIPVSPKMPGKKMTKKPSVKSGKKTDKPVETSAISEDEINSGTVLESTEIEAEDTDNSDLPDDGEDSVLREVAVSDMDAAKDYLAENYDVVRTKLKTEESIKNTAAAFGIMFKYM